MTPQQYNRWVEEINRQNRRNIDNYNREVKKHNDQVNRSIDQHNREVKRVHDENNRRIQNYNNQVRQFNNTQRQNLNRAIDKFNQSIRTALHSTTIVYWESVHNLESRYADLDNYNKSNHISKSNLLIDYPTQETNNSIQLYNSISGTDQGDYLDPGGLQVSEIEEKLYAVSDELGKRWQGGLYSLNPNNPDAARHFCSSIREVFIQLLDIKAPDNKVLQAFPNCLMHENRPARREKIKFILASQSIANSPMIEFVNADVEDLLKLFQTLNDAIHGTAGAFSVQQLLKIKKRAEDSILFITSFQN